MTGLLVVALLSAGTGAAEYRVTGQQVVVETPVYRCSFDPQTGALLRVEVPGKGPLAVGGPQGDLWRLGLRDGSSLGAAQAAQDNPLRRHWDAATQTLTLEWSAVQAKVSVAVVADKSGVELRARVMNTGQQPVLRLSLPAELAFPARGLRLLTWPESTGLGLTRRWLQPPGAAAPSRWESRPLAGRLLRRLLGSGAQMRDLPGTARPLRVTKEGLRLLGASMAARLRGVSKSVTRPPEATPDLVVIENDDGPYLAAFRLGGKGWFAYFCGMSDERVAVSVVPKLLDTWTSSSAGKKIGLISLRGHSSGGWMSVPLSRWQDLLPTLLRGRKIVRLESSDALEQALKDQSFAAIFNPYAEHLVADTPQQADRIIDELKQFVRRGGIWLDGGGYPFYYILKRGRFGHFAGNYPPLFADFIHLDSDFGQLAVYRTQREDRIFVPAHLELTGAEVQSRPAAVFSRYFATWIEPGESWTAPPVILTFGKGLREACAQYVRDNGLTRPAAEKMAPEKLDRFRRSLLIRLVGRKIADYVSYLPQLPSPNLLHMTEHLHIGFDKAYPNYLPPRPGFGTMGELRALYRQAHKLGFLMMPYVNPTWWCDESESLAKYGRQVLALGLDGKPYREAYGFSEPRNRGWSICALHPLVRKLDDRCLEQFVRDLGSDVLFQDQIGARSWKYDLNPAEPTPYAYTEGMIELARHDSKVVPLSTERGWDRLINYELQFCGVAFATVPKRGRVLWSQPFWEMLGDGEWQSSPVALYMAHDKVAFTLHDLGHFIDDERALAMALVMGHQLSLALAVGTPPTSQRYQWLLWLDRLQKEIAARYLFQPLEAQRHLAQLAIESRYSDMTVVGSLEKDFVSYGKVKLASPGYYVASGSGDLEAGRLALYGAREYAADRPLEFVKRREGNRERWWLFSADKVTLPVGEARRVWVLEGQGRRAAPIVTKDGERFVEAQPPRLGGEPPAELRNLPPARWPRAPKYIGLIYLKPHGPRPGWTDAGPDEWEKSLKASKILGRQLLELRELTTPEAVLEACGRPREYFAIINPYGELFPVTGPDAVKQMLDAVAAYIRDGGIWWETGGYSFFYPVWPKRQQGRIVTWQVGQGMAGMNVLLGPAAILPDDAPPEPLAVTGVGKLLLSQDVQAQLQGAQAVVNRPTSAAVKGWSLMAGRSGDYVAGYSPQGWGWLFRVGGRGQIKLTLPFVESTIEYLFHHPPAQEAPGQVKRVWQVLIEY